MLLNCIYNLLKPIIMKAYKFKNQEDKEYIKEMLNSNNDADISKLIDDAFGIRLTISDDLHLINNCECDKLEFVDNIELLFN